MAHGPVLNPIAHLAKINPPPPVSREAKALARRVAKFEAQRAQEASMNLTMTASDLSPTPPATKLTKQAVPKGTAPAAPVHAGKPPMPPAPSPAVQRVSRVPDNAGQSTEADVFAELAQEFSEAAATTETPETPVTPPAEDFDPDTILKRFKGSPDEIAKQLAKSYANSEKRMRQLENEKQLLMQQVTHPAPGQSQPVVPAAPVVPPVQQQVQITPQFDYKKWGEQLLEHPDERAKELVDYAAAVTQDKLLRDFIAPLYDAEVENRLFRKFPDVVTEENLDVLKAMAYKEPGTNRWEKLVNAVAKYKAAMPTTTTPSVPVDVQQMQQAAHQPTPQARTSEKKMWKASDLRKLMQRPDYKTDPSKRALVDRAYAEGRVLREQ